ncbi:hypothetical protein [Paracoccus tegillarcae]|uniref:Uncharacterized protein n=1 Tax=Paracoccus tegillarcae TaxID=1529068 RepID=A0A2K9EM39_9RHOB|nr:hypothetical protein [Paracoccus tegillarcae]AUH34497.1 hypothetical protein CUV01_14875 [Paracoccus tegillarcae]
MSEPVPGLDEADPKHLIRESFRIDGITAEECRSIFVDWALSLPATLEPSQAARVLLDHYAPLARASGGAAHPMVQMLVEGARNPADNPPRRRGGRAGRFSR